MNRSTIFGALALVLLAATASAQTQVPSPTPPTTRLAWDHDGVATDRYLLTVDGTATDLGKPAPVSGQTYEVAFPALTPGTHTLMVCAENIAGRSCSAPFPVSVVVVPTAPGSLRIVTR